MIPLLFVQDFDTSKHIMKLAATIWIDPRDYQDPAPKILPSTS